MQYQEILAAFRNLKVLVIGDAMLDEYVGTTIERVSPEAPVQVARAEKRSYTPGGAANVANNLARLGAQVAIACVTGDDEKGEILRTVLARNGISTDGVLVDTERPTTTKTRIMAGRYQMLRVDDELDRPIPAKITRSIMRFMEARLPSYNGVIVSDYSKGVLTDGLLKRLISLSHKKNKPVVIGPKGNSFDKYRGADVIVPNTAEVTAVYGQRLASEDDFKDAARHLLGQTQCKAILITRGEAGMSLYQDNGDYDHIFNKAKEVYDVTGAGDTALSVVSLALFSGASYSDAAKLANIAAGIVVGKVGTATVNVDEINDTMASEASPFDRKVKNLARLKAILDEKKKQGKRIVFTNGCFDLLHIGHIKLLEQAKNFGDELVVALNSDSSTSALKGAGRPLIPETERAHIISSLSSVDYVIIFSELTPETLIRELKPDILVKGADYKAAAVVGKEIVQSYGGRVVLVPLVEDKSTSRLIEKLHRTD